MRTRIATTLSCLILSACGTAEPPAPIEQTLHIFAINDFHGALYEINDKKHPGKVLGGLPFLKGAIDGLRADFPQSLLLDGGDVFQGTWPVNQSQGMGSVRALNLLGVDAAAVGNHEFDYGGYEGLDPRLGALQRGAKAADWAWLSANIERVADDGTTAPWRPEGIAPWTVLEQGGIKLGVIGLTTADTPQTTLAANVRELRFLDVVDSVNAVLPAVEAAGVHAVAIVGHLTGTCDDDGKGSCTPDGELGRLLTELPSGAVDLIVSGHMHTRIAARVGDTLVVQNLARGMAIGHVELVFRDGQLDLDGSTVREPWMLRHDPADPGCDEGEYDTRPQRIGERTVTPDTQALALIDQLEADSGSLCTTLGCTAHSLGRSRGAESEVGNLSADAMRAAFPTADLALTNSGGLRADIPEGTLRREHLQAVMPFDNRMVMVELSGARLRKLLRIGLSGQHGLLQLSGGRVHIDPDRSEGTDLDGDGQVTKWEADRLCSVSVSGAPLDPSATYRVVLTDFLLGGGDHLGPALDGAKVLSTGDMLRDQLYSYAESHSGCIGVGKSLVDPAQPRIRQAPCE